MSISTHILDLSRGTPAHEVGVVLEIQGVTGGWKTVGKGRTDTHGRCSLVPSGSRLQSGTYRLTYDTAAYFRTQNVPCFYPEISIVITARDPSQDYHLPLLLSPYGYSTYRGS